MCCHSGKKGKEHAARRIEPVSVVCAGCGSSFLTGGRGRPKYGTKHCTNACRGVASSKQPDIRKMSGEEIAWLAGLFDGEGNIAWPRKGNVHSARVSICNTNFELLDKIVEVTGTGSQVGLSRGNDKHAPAKNWTVYGDRAKHLLKLMLPWLIVKRTNAEIVLEAAEAHALGIPAPRSPEKSSRST